MQEALVCDVLIKEFHLQRENYYEDDEQRVEIYDLKNEYPKVVEVVLLINCITIVVD